jgi:hypothetical protein
MTDAKELIDRYFDLAPRPGADAYLAQFAGDAVVEDDGQAHRGIAAIRAWRSKVPRVASTIHDVKTASTGHAAAVDIAGDFPGSPVTLDLPFPVRGRRAHHRPHHPPLTRPANQPQPSPPGRAAPPRDDPSSRRTPSPARTSPGRCPGAANRVISVPARDDDRSCDGPMPETPKRHDEGLAGPAHGQQLNVPRAVRLPAGTYQCHKSKHLAETKSGRSPD